MSLILSFLCMCVCVCEHALPFFLVSVCLSLSLPLRFSPAVIFVLFAHSPSPILAWLLAYLLYYQASVFLGKRTRECRCVRECVRVRMLAYERVAAPHWFVKKSAPNSKSTIGTAFLPGLSHNFFVCLMFLRASSKCDCLCIGASPMRII